MRRFYSYSHRSTKIYTSLLNEPILEGVSIAAAAILENKLVPEFKVSSMLLIAPKKSTPKFSELLDSDTIFCVRHTFDYARIGLLVTAKLSEKIMTSSPLLGLAAL